MDIITPQQLWQDYDRHTPPEVSLISSAQNERRQYFSGFRTDGALVRVYSRLVLPEGKEKPPVIILAAPADKDIDSIDPTLLTSAGFAVLFVDYFGKREGKTRYTIYPKQLAAFWESEPQKITVPPANPKESCWFYWTTIMLHAVTFLEGESDINPAKIGIFGIKEGASLVFKASICPEIKAGITFFCGDIMAGNGEQAEEMLPYKISLDSRSYAGGYFPILINATTNEQGNAFDYLSDLYSHTQNTRLSVLANASAAVSEYQRANISRWFERAFEGQKLPDAPEVSVFGSCGAMYAQVITSATEVKLYYAEDCPASLRNFKRVIPQKSGENKYLSKLDVTDPLKTLQVFANIRYEDGFVLSTQVVTKQPQKLAVTGENNFSRLIYQNDGEKRGFLYPDGEFMQSNLLETAEGPHGLLGLRGDCLVTFRPGDTRYRGKEDSLLQIMVSCFAAQEVEIFVIDIEGTAFRCARRIPAKEWTTVTLSSEDFKSPKGQAKFDRIAGIKICGSGVILNSLLWV